MIIYVETSHFQWDLIMEHLQTQLVKEGHLREIFVLRLEHRRDGFCHGLGGVRKQYLTIHLIHSMACASINKDI